MKTNKYCLKNLSRKTILIFNVFLEYNKYKETYNIIIKNNIHKIF